MPRTESATDGRIAVVRRFTRFYTRRIGVLEEGPLASEFSLTEGRVLWELAHGEDLTATALGRKLGVDPGYLSRILTGFERRRLLTRTPSPDDGRRSVLTLTEAGRAAFAPLDARSGDEVGAMLRELTSGEQSELVSAMKTIMRLLDRSTADREAAQAGPADSSAATSSPGMPPDAAAARSPARSARAASRSAPMARR